MNWSRVDGPSSEINETREGKMAASYCLRPCFSICKQKNIRSFVNEMLLRRNMSFSNPNMWLNITYMWNVSLVYRKHILPTFILVIRLVKSEPVNTWVKTTIFLSCSRLVFSCLLVLHFHDSAHTRNDINIKLIHIHNQWRHTSCFTIQTWDFRCYSDPQLTWFTAWLVIL